MPKPLFPSQLIFHPSPVASLHLCPSEGLNDREHQIEYVQHKDCASAYVNGCSIVQQMRCDLFGEEQRNGRDIGRRPVPLHNAHRVRDREVREQHRAQQQGGRPVRIRQDAGRSQGGSSIRDRNRMGGVCHGEGLRDGQRCSRVQEMVARQRGEV